MLAWRRYQDSLCRGCGHPKSLAHDPENDGRFKATGTECHACTAAEREKHADSKEPVKPVVYYGTTYEPPAPEFQPPPSPEGRSSS